MSLEYFAGCLANRHRQMLKAAANFGSGTHEFRTFMLNTPAALDDRDLRASQMKSFSHRHTATRDHASNAIGVARMRGLSTTGGSLTRLMRRQSSDDLFDGLDCATRIRAGCTNDDL